MTNFAVIHLPITDNDGKSLRAENDAILREVAEKHGGFTVCYGYGGWLNDGILYNDAILRVIVAGAEDKAEWEALAERVKITHRQLSVYVEYYQGEVKFI